ncbi:hypothetical protein CTM62_10130 [Prevotella intermedia]|uniref:Uncharacterized protein n=1 Tax=Prevotella intermedia TaxID=28131 RepID=A0A2D3L9D2_PREIN|nr:hypothetical protein CTM62_10130 [Prevotella intermedia]
MNKTKSHANRKFAWLLFFAFEQAGDQSKEAKESRKSHQSYHAFIFLYSARKPLILSTESSVFCRLVGKPSI